MTAATSDNAVQIAVIGGSGLYTLAADATSEPHAVKTPFADTAVTVYLEHTSAGPVWFLPRHGKTHNIAPHQINYRANLWALHRLGVSTVIAVNAVGGITERMQPGALVLPDQLIDYSWGREHTFATGEHAFDKHVDFTWPYDADLGKMLRQSALMLDIPVLRGAVYACTQGPRLETAAEIRKLKQDGCDIVGMTGMPEAGLARELALRYACLALVVNKAAGMGDGVITMAEIEQTLAAGIDQVRTLLLAALPQLATA
jgi:5'-methylthioinosine phosphorylase